MTRKAEKAEPDASGPLTLAEATAQHHEAIEERDRAIGFRQELKQRLAGGDLLVSVEALREANEQADYLSLRAQGTERLVDAARERERTGAAEKLADESEKVLTELLADVAGARAEMVTAVERFILTGTRLKSEVARLNGQASALLPPGLDQDLRVPPAPFDRLYSQGAFGKIPGVTGPIARWSLTAATIGSCLQAMLETAPPRAIGPKDRNTFSDLYRSLRGETKKLTNVLSQLQAVGPKKPPEDLAKLRELVGSGAGAVSAEDGELLTSTEIKVPVHPAMAHPVWDPTDEPPEEVSA